MYNKFSTSDTPEYSFDIVMKNTQVKSPKLRFPWSK